MIWLQKTKAKNTTVRQM